MAERAPRSRLGIDRSYWIGGPELRDFIVKHPNCTAAVWFGLVGLFIWRIILIVAYHRVLIGPDLFSELLPVISAGVIGAWLGGKIVREASTRGLPFAVKRGIAVMLLSALFYCLLIALLAAVIDGSTDYSLGILLEFILIGVLGFGWLIALAGAFVGWLLYRLSRG